MPRRARRASACSAGGGLPRKSDGAEGRVVDKLSNGGTVGAAAVDGMRAYACGRAAALRRRSLTRTSHMPAANWAMPP